MLMDGEERNIKVISTLTTVECRLPTRGNDEHDVNYRGSSDGGVVLLRS